MQLEGSCHCGAVRFTVQSREAVPFMRCYCSICRKTSGSGGLAVNLGADHATLQVQGREHLSVYRARRADGTQSTGQRHFCRHCGSPLWLWDATWPDLVHPHAGAIDTPLPVPAHRAHIFLADKPAWVEAHVQPGDRGFDAYPDFSLAEWHQRHGVQT